MSSAVKNSSSAPSHTEPPRGTMASPNTVMTIEPVRDGSRFSCSTTRASGGGMLQRIPRFVDLRQRRLTRGERRCLFYRSPQAGRGKANGCAESAVRIRINHAAPAAAIERGPFAFRLRQPVGHCIDRRGMMAHAAMAAFDLDAFGAGRRLFHAALPGA